MKVQRRQAAVEWVGGGGGGGRHSGLQGTQAQTQTRVQGAHHQTARTCPRSTSSRLMPRMRRPTLSPACPSFRLFLNISTPAGEQRRRCGTSGTRCGTSGTRCGATRSQTAGWASTPGRGGYPALPSPKARCPSAERAHTSCTRCSTTESPRPTPTSDGGLGVGGADAHNLHLVTSLDDALLHAASHHGAAALQLSSNQKEVRSAC